MVVDFLGDLFILSGVIIHKNILNNNIMELKEIQNLIKFVAKSGANEVKLEMGDVKITIKTGAGRQETNYFQQAAPVSMP